MSAVRGFNLMSAGPAISSPSSTAYSPTGPGEVRTSKQQIQGRNPDIPLPNDTLQLLLDHMLLGAINKHVTTFLTELRKLIQKVYFVFKQSL